MRTQFKFTHMLICTPVYIYTTEYIYMRVFFCASELDFNHHYEHGLVLDYTCIWCIHILDRTPILKMPILKWQFGHFETQWAWKSRPSTLPVTNKTD